MTTLKRWEEQGQYIEVDGHQIFVVDTKIGEQVLLILHGFPTSSYDFWKTLPLLARKYRVIVHDHLGYGFSDKPMNYSYSLIEQAEKALLLWVKLGIKRGHIVAHDYGTSVATEIIARYNKNFISLDIQSLLLTNGSLLIELANLRLVQRLMRHKQIGKWTKYITNAVIFKINMRRLWADKSKINENELHEMWQLLVHKGGKETLHLVSRYTHERTKYWHRWIGGLEDTKVPISFLWGDKDPVALPVIASTLHKKVRNSQLFWLKDVGHYPMLEAPKIWVKETLNFIESLG